MVHVIAKSGSRMALDMARLRGLNEAGELYLFPSRSQLDFLFVGFFLWLDDSTCIRDTLGGLQCPKERDPLSPRIYIDSGKEIYSSQLDSEELPDG